MYVFLMYRQNLKYIMPEGHIKLTYYPYVKQVSRLNFVEWNTNDSTDIKISIVTMFHYYDIKIHLFLKE